MFDQFTAKYHVFMEKNVAIKMGYSPLFHEILLIFNITISGNAIVIDINFKTWILKVARFDDVYTKGR